MFTKFGTGQSLGQVQVKQGDKPADKDEKNSKPVPVQVTPTVPGK